ncbi:uncharacterized protein LOC135210759 isoform X3 [Macrobrachium nipponense]
MNGFIRRRHWARARLVVGCLVVVLPPSLLCSGLKCREVRSLGKNENAINPLSQETITVVAVWPHRRMKFDLEIVASANKIKLKAQFVMYQHRLSVALWEASLASLSNNSSKCFCLKPAEDRHFMISMKQDDTPEDNIIIRSNDEIILKSGIHVEEKSYFFNLTNLDKVKLNVSFCEKETTQESSLLPPASLLDSSNCSLNEIYSMMQREDTSTNSIFYKNYEIIYVNFGFGLTLLVALFCALCKCKRNLKGRERQNGVSPPPDDDRVQADRESVGSHIYEDPYQFLNTVTSNAV